jgi:signal transduction histidine kinase
VKFPTSITLADAKRSIVKVGLALETDFLLARQRAKQIAALLAFELQDQTRIATAVSEIARNAWEYGKGGQVEFLLDPAGTHGPVPALRIVITDRGPGIPNIEEIWAGTYKSETGMGIGLAGARRLIDELTVTSTSDGTRATLVKYLPRNAPIPPSLAEIATVLAGSVPGAKSASLALQDQNQELLALLSDLRARESELRALNAELEDTNRGVLVLYAEIADKAQAVQQASEMKTRFLSGVTHELRTPLNSIVSLARLMLGHADGPLNPEQEKQVNFILRSAQNLTEMVNDLLDLAKIEAGKSSTVISTFSVQSLFAALRGMFRPLATNPNVKLIFEIPEDSLELISDEGKLSQILRNFISNALKFTEQGTITVTASAHPGDDPRQIRFSVADTGIGIAPEHHEVVMQEWGQVSSPTPEGVSHVKGSGLGLPLSSSLAELLNGSIGFTSSPGVGSTFYVTLPALAQPAEPTLLPEAPGHILIVDDDEVARYVLSRQLGTLTSALIEEVTSGADALASIARRLPRLVFLDLIMPGMLGSDVARQLRSHPETADLPIVLHTSKVLTAEELSSFETLDLIIIGKRPTGGFTLEDDDTQRAEIERALLEVGLSNLHLERAR